MAPAPRRTARRHDLATELIEVAQDRGRVPPDPDHRDDLSVELDREVGAQHVTCRKWGTDRLGIRDRMEPCCDGAAGRGDEIGRRLPACPAGGPGAGQEEGAVRRPDFDAHDLAGGIDRRELRLEGGGPRHWQVAGHQVGGPDIPVDEAANSGGIGADDRAENGL